MLIEKELFDKWANKYENDIHTLQNVYPFAGYFDAIAHIRQLFETKDVKDILDLGVGTGLMLSKIIEDRNYDYFGCDFSDKMVEFARKRLSTDQLFVHDIRVPKIPTQLEGKLFDCIYSAYTFHHFEIPLKIDIIQTYLKLLKPNGRLLIIDISFDNEAALKVVKADVAERWDSDEEMGYFRKDEFMQALEERFQATYTKISYCCGIYEIENVSK